jgi:hypothetical protein
MPTYRVERPLGEDGAAEIDAAAFRALACIPHFKGMMWLRSYYDAGIGLLTCYYAAENPDDIRRHAEMAAIPCAAVDEVVEYLPDSYR